MRNNLLGVGLLILVGSCLSANYAVLIQGSSGWYNYGQGSDNCHAYNTLINGGYDPNNIILFSYNDLAFNSQNPFPGKLFNSPDSPDYYPKCVIDYTGLEVTPQNYLNVLKGDSTAMKGIGSGRVLKATKNDSVFFFYSDHGGMGLVAFPGSYLYAVDLQAVLTQIWQKGGYGKAVYYMEACNSGSMFMNFPTNQMLYAVTSATPYQSAWMTYCPPDDDVINGVHMGTCIGDMFSTSYLFNADATNTDKQTLQQEFVTVSALVTESQCCQYGDLSFVSDNVSGFLGNSNPSGINKITGKPVSQIKTPKGKTHISKREYKLRMLINRHAALMTAETQAELNTEILSRKFFDDIFFKIKAMNHEVPRATNTNFDCYKDMINTFETACGRFSDYGMQYMEVFYNLCNTQKDTFPVKAFFIQTCSRKAKME